LLRTEIPAQGPGAAVLILHEGKVLYRGAVGRKNLHTAQPLHTGTRFCIGSITKTFTAAAMLSLVADHRLALQDTLAKFFPTFPHGGEITLAQLLDHTSGISDAWEANPAEPLPPAKLMTILQTLPLDFPPGTQWRYSNSGYLVLGAVLEQVTGKPWDEAIRAQILQPLQLRETGCSEGEQPGAPGAAVGYSQDAEGRVVPAPLINLRGYGTAGGLISTVDDVGTFLQALLKGRLIPKPLVKMMLEERSTQSGQPVGYGLGVMVGKVRGAPVQEHNGSIEGYASHWIYFPEQKIAVIVLANTDGGEINPRSLARRLGALAIGRPYAPIVPARATASRLDELVGAYQIDGNTVRHISLREGRLYTRRAEGPDRPLLLVRGDALVIRGDGIDWFRLVRDEKGRVIALDFCPEGSKAIRREPRVDRVR
jgi:CubicO group peptidase (beta-lactamase class C family)